MHTPDALLVIAIEADKCKGVREPERDEHQEHRQHMERMMTNLAHSAVRQEVAIGEVSASVAAVSSDLSKQAKQIKKLEKPANYEMDVVRDDNGDIWKINVRAV